MARKGESDIKRGLMKKKKDIKKSMGTDGKDTKICARNKTREIKKISMGGKNIKFCESY